MKTQQIVRDGAGHYYLVEELEDERLAHTYYGTPVKKSGKRQLGNYTVPAWVAKKHALPRLIRKAATVVVATVEAGSVVEG